MRLLAILLLSIIVLRAQEQGRSVRGIILGSAGQPVTNALVTVRSVTRESGTRYTNNDDVTGSARSDANGAFTLRGTSEFSAATVTVEAAGHARGIFPQISAGDRTHELKLVQGAIVKGMVLQNNAPLANAPVTIADAAASSTIFNFQTSTTTDAQGRFAFEHLTPRRDYIVYGPATNAVIAAKKVTVKGDQTILDTGPLSTSAGFTVKGRLHLRDGDPVSAPVTLGRHGTSVSLKTFADSDGSFEFRSTPAEIITLTPELRGHRLSARNASLAPDSMTHLAGRLSTNVSLVIELEPGEPLPSLTIAPAALREEPLRGIEIPQPAPQSFRVTGTLQNASAPIELSEGRFAADGGFNWFYNRRQIITNSTFTYYVERRDQPAAITIESDHHLPWISGPITSHTNLAITLEKGIAITGALEQPGGEAATNVTVYLTDETYGIHISGPPLQLAHPLNKHLRKTVTDATGRFSFRPHPAAASIVILDDAGFAHVKVDELPGGSRVRLQRWASLQGKIQIGDTPGADEVIRLASAPAPYEWYPRELPALSLLLTTRADAQGNFAFERVPPIMVEVAQSPLTGDAALGPIALTQSRRLILQPGAATNVTLGGEGRTVFGRFRVSGYDGAISWQSSPQTMEKIVPHNGPSDSAMRVLLEKLSQTGSASSVRAERERAEKEYQQARARFAHDAQEYFKTNEGLGSLLATRRYHIYIADDGAFRIDDVPPGNYRVQLHLMNTDPSVLGTRRATIADSSTELTIPPGVGPHDAGVIEIPARKPSAR